MVSYLHTRDECTDSVIDGLSLVVGELVSQSDEPLELCGFGVCDLRRCEFRADLLCGPLHESPASFGCVHVLFDYATYEKYASGLVVAACMGPNLKVAVCTDRRIVLRSSHHADVPKIVATHQSATHDLRATHHLSANIREAGSENWTTVAVLDLTAERKELVDGYRLGLHHLMADATEALDLGELAGALRLECRTNHIAERLDALVDGFGRKRFDTRRSGSIVHESLYVEKRLFSH